MGQSLHPFESDRSETGKKFIDITQASFISARAALRRALEITEAWDRERFETLREQQILSDGIIRQGDTFLRLTVPDGSGDRLDLPQKLSCEGIIDHIKAIHKAVKQDKA